MTIGPYEFVLELRRLGREEGRKASILQILKSRRIVVDADSLKRITSCGDMETLDAWIGRSLTIAETGELELKGTAMRHAVPYVPGRLVPYVSLDKEAEAKIRARMSPETGRMASEQRMLGWWEGWQEKATKSILRILDAEGIAVDKRSRDQIVACTDIDTLETWLGRCFTITEIAELFQG